MRAVTAKLWLCALLYAICLPVAVIENRAAPYTESYYFLLCVVEISVFGIGLFIGKMIDELCKEGVKR